MLQNLHIHPALETKFTTEVPIPPNRIGVKTHKTVKIVTLQLATCSDVRGGGCCVVGGGGCAGGTSLTPHLHFGREEGPTL